MIVGKIVRSSQWGGDVHPPGTANVPVAPKRQETLHCPDEKQQGSCPALPTRKSAWELHCPDGKAAGRCTLTKKLKRRRKSPNTRILRSQKIIYVNVALCGFFSSLLLLLCFFFFFLQRWYPARPSTNFRWRVQIILPGLHSLPVEDDARGH